MLAFCAQGIVSAHLICARDSLQRHEITYLKNCKLMHILVLTCGDHLL